MVWPPVVCPVLPTKVSEREGGRETRVYAYGRTNKEASIGVVSEARGGTKMGDGRKIAERERDGGHG